ncbi:MAG TPA: malto-oligosyltrehalose synthase, partial [Thermoanaerobaculia bacterium]
YNRLVSLNEVGGEPGRAPDFDPVEEFHQRNEMIARDWACTMNATSTHDTKRSEDVRARINVLSELADTWTREAKRWSKLNAPLRENRIPAPNEELLIYQTLVGMWPLDPEELDSVPDRLRAYLEKAAREAKTHTSWLQPNADYEKRLLDYGVAVARSDPFKQAFLRLQKRVAFHGFLNSLAQVVLKATAPGLPDFYQGTELWDFSLVDPDNRRPVDYERRAMSLRKLVAADAKGGVDVASLLRRWFDGRIKLYTTWKTLAVRARHAETFRSGEYRALRTESPNVVAYLRGDDILVAAPRLTTQLVSPPELPVGAVWGDLTLPVEGTWRNAFTGQTVTAEKGRLAMSNVLASFPVAICERA